MTANSLLDSRGIPTSFQAGDVFTWNIRDRYFLVTRGSEPLTVDGDEKFDPFAIYPERALKFMLLGRQLDFTSEVVTVEEGEQVTHTRYVLVS